MNLIRQMWNEVRGDVRRVGLWLALAMIAAVSLRFVPWGGLPGDLLSAIAFVLVLLIVLVHVLRRIALPLQLLVYARDAKENKNIASAIVFAAVVVFMVALLWAGVTLFVRPAGAAELPAGLPAHAYANLPIVMKAQTDYWSDHPLRSALAAQVEQETCPSLKSAQCWSERAELKTNRERGVGLGQCTKTARFDCLSDMKIRYAAQLAGWSWAAPYNALYQARALVLQDKALFFGVSGAANSKERLAMMLNCYNAGCGTLAKRRALCSKTVGCDASRWFGNVALAVGQPQSVTKGYGKSFQQIATEYPHLVLNVRRPRYVFLDRGAA